MVRDEVESWENLLLLLEVLVKSPLTKINLRDELLENLVTTLSVGCIDNAWIIAGVAHETLPLSIDFLEALCVFRELSSDILRGQEDWLKSHPLLLHFNPEDEHLINGLESLLPLEELRFKLF